MQVKHHRGKDLKRPQVWVFGLYERPLVQGQRARVLFFIVPKRDAFTLLNLIYKHVAPGTIIHSDSWSAYSRIRNTDRNFIHRKVNHQLHFVDPEDRTLHTNSIESMWCQAKAHIKRMRGVSRSYLASYLIEFIWRNNAAVGGCTNVDLADKIVNEMGLQYPAVDPIETTDLNIQLAQLDLGNDDVPIDVVAFGRVPVEIYPLPDYSTEISETIEVDKFLDSSNFLEINSFVTKKTKF